MADDKMRTIRLGEVVVAPPTPGIKQSSSGVGAPVHFIGAAAVVDGRAGLEVVPTELTYAAPRDRLVAEGDLLLLNRGLERRDRVPCSVVRFKEAAAFAETLTRVRLDPTLVDADYVRLFLTSRRGATALAAATAGGSVSVLRKDALLDVELVVPDLPAQHRAVEKMRQLETQVREAEDTASLLRDLYDTTREGLIGGQLRVT